MQHVAIEQRRRRLSASQNVRARSTISSNTGCASPGEADITFSTSMVAACCSIRSPYSLLRCGQRRRALLQFAICLGAGDGDHRLFGEGPQQFHLRSR